MREQLLLTRSSSTPKPTDEVTITATPGMGDFISISPTSLTFTASDWDTAQDIVVTALEDGRKATSTTNATIRHQVSGGDYDSETVDNIQVTITDTTTHEISLVPARADESDGHIEFTVTVQPTLGEAIEVRYTTTDGTATAPTDYIREVGHRSDIQSIHHTGKPEQRRHSDIHRRQPGVQTRREDLYPATDQS